MEIYIAVVVVVVSVIFGFFAFRKSSKEEQAAALIRKAPIALDERKYQPFQLVAKEQINHNTVRLRFALQSDRHRLGLPVGKHMLLKFEDSDEAKTPVSRPYTPTSSDDELGYFELIIKLYETGKMSQHLKKLSIGNTIDCRGPLGPLSYESQGVFTVKRKNAATGASEMVERSVNHVGMIAGGSGITPMLQIIRSVCKNSRDNMQVSLIYANVTEEDILMRQELDDYASKFPNIKVYYTLDRPSDSWKMGRGFVSTDMIKSFLPAPLEDTFILVCGPPGMMVAMQKNLDSLGYTEDMIYKY